MENKRKISDPRPDLQEDSETWEKLLNMESVKKDYDVCWLLHGFRCQGTALIRHGDTYVLRPRLRKDCWNSKEEYVEQRNRYLVPHRDKLARALKLLAEEEGAQNAG